MTKREESFILWFEDIGISDISLVGGKNASLGEMIQNLDSKGVKVPGGFAITAYAYRYLLEKAGIETAIKDTLEGLNTHDMANLSERGHQIRKIIREADFPDELVVEIVDAYKKLCDRYDQDNVDVAVRSSATAEDLPDASFAGQQDTYLNISGSAALINACKKCFASLFTNRAISYREDRGFGHFDVYLSIAVQKMIRSDSSCSGVMFSIDTESGFRDAVFITGSYGLGENVVQGAVNPDEYYVFKPTLKQGMSPIVSKTLGEKAIKMVYTNDKKDPVKNVFVPDQDRTRFVISDEEVLKLASWAVIIEEHYTKEAMAAAKKARKTLPDNFLKPMDIEWAKDGDGKKVGTGELFIVQARPETVHSQKEMIRINQGKREFHIQSHKYAETKEYQKWKVGREKDALDDWVRAKYKTLAEGRAVGEMIGKGKVNNIPSVSDIDRFKRGEILVTSMTDPDWEPIMKIASAIVTDKGGRTCHAAIISRELGIPCIVGSMTGTKTLISGMDVTVSCVEGDTGRVYSGNVPSEIEDSWIEIPDTKTKILMNAGIPELAFNQGQIPNDGVGLAREEFIINSHIGIHPNALMNFNKIKSDLKHLDSLSYGTELDISGLEETKKKLREVVKVIEERTVGYDDKSEFFVKKLARGIARIGAAFYPNEVVVRMSDFKTNEYANLVGGFLYEPEENNPMIGWRGASRYYDPTYKEAFGLECRAIKMTRDDMGLTNIIPMIPFCRTPTEARKVIATMEEFGLKRGENGLEVYVMAEIPSNVIVADEFAEIFDGFSIGSNDLTQLALGLDRDSALVAHIYNENEQTVLRLVEQLIQVAHKHKRKVGICGQAPSDYPEFAQFLVKCGIDSISLNPDTVLKTKLEIAAMEKKLGIKVPKKK